MMEKVSTEDRPEGPPRKRLLTDLYPKQNFVIESPESTVSFDSSSDRLAKKTRELPNLSDCHSCGVRINYTNPRERLQPLDSMWRIVLLCKKCTKRVSSSNICTYCFTLIVDKNDCFKCRDCQHSIHKDCVARYGSGLGLGFSVCVDCWVPDAMAKTIRKRKFRKNNESCEQTANLSKSRVSAEETNQPVTFVEKTKRKVVLGVVASRKVAAGREQKVVDDAELAFLMHRAINSSARISKYTCLASSVTGDDASIACYSRRRASNKIDLMNSSSLSVPLICYSRRHKKGFLTNSASLNAPLICYSRRRSSSKACSHDTECERTDKHGSTSSAGLKVCDLASNSENSLSGNNCQQNDVERIDKEPDRYLLKYYRTGKRQTKAFAFC